MGLDYKSSGVDVNAGYKSVELITKHVNSTFRSEVIGGLGGFGGMFSIAKAKEMEEPVLVSGTDGVGTKLKLAFLTDKHDTIGIDCVAMCVNDVVCSGAEPLFFLDYIACGKNYPEKIEQIVKGITDGCNMAGVSLIGGETAEMPDFYKHDEYDLAGFTVGILDKTKIIDGKNIKKGDVLIGLASSGLHSNGFSLVRKVFRPNKLSLDEYIEDIGKTLGEELITPTRIYVKSILSAIKNIEIKGISNITGGGFIENIPRIIPKGLGVKIFEGTWEVAPIFKIIQTNGEIERLHMYNTFNMGIGMVAVVESSLVEQAVKQFKELGEKAFVIGEVVEGNGVEIC